MADGAALAERFEADRARLRMVAYRMLGSLTEADDAVQEAWLRASAAGDDNVRNLPGWLTTIVARISLNMLRTRSARREEPLDAYVPDPILDRPDRDAPEDRALLGDSVGLALMVVLNTLTPVERVAFVLHDLFAVPFEEIAALIERTPAATRQLASRARRQVREAPVPDPDRARQRAAVDAFFAAAREGDLNRLMAVLDPDVVLRADGGAGPGWSSAFMRGAARVSGQSVIGARMSPYLQPALINGTEGGVAIANGRLLAVMAFTISGDRIVGMDFLIDAERLATLDISGFEPDGQQL
jgi:RNA polymerase sigma factor (sigma-70 family)